MNLNRQIVILFVMTAAALSQSHSMNHEQLKEHLIKLENQSWQAWQGRDGRFFDGFLSTDHVEVGATGVSAKEDIVKFVASPICVVKSYSVRDFKMTVFNSDTALLTYHAEQDTTCNGHPVPSPAWASSLYVKKNGRWMNALYQQTAK